MIATATASHSPVFTPPTSSQIERPGSRLAHGGGGLYGSGDGRVRDVPRTQNGINPSSNPAARSAHTSDDEGFSRNRRMTRETTVPSRMYVRALYNYSTEDPTSLSFNSGDVIQVLKQLDSGWWDGIVHGQRGWFPSNYCALITPTDFANGNGNSPLDDSDDLDEDDSYDEYEEDEDSEHDGLASPGLPLEGTDDKENDEAAFWIPQATPDGRLYYFNTSTGASRMELPLEAPTSTTETGPRERSNFSAPDQTRPPPEMMARGYERDESYQNGTHDDADSLSDKDGDMPLMSNNANEHEQRESRGTHVDSAATSIDSVRNVPPPLKTSHSMSFSNATTIHSMGPSFHSKSGTANYFDHGLPLPKSWDELIERTGLAVERYRRAVNDMDRGQYVRRAEEISDMLRLLIAAGSATTDNHSGQPSIISSNKTLNPHFRHFMAAFSKLVLSSHVAATDCPPPDAESKCLGEADEVMVGVYGFAETAKTQRGEKLPRLMPGFVQGSHAGGSWAGVPTPTSATSKALADISPIEDLSMPLDSNFADKMEELDTIVKPTLKRLDATLANSEPLVTQQQQATIGVNVITAAQAAFDAIRRYFSLIDNVKMGSSMSEAVQSPTFVDFITQKQRLHDSFADLFLACQSVTAQLADEWTCIRGEPLEERLNSVKVFIKEVESGMRSLDFTIQLLVAEREGEEKDREITRIDATNEMSPMDGPVRGHQRSLSRQPLPRASTMDRPQGTSKLEKVLGVSLNQTPETPQEVTPKYLMSDLDSEIMYGAKGQVKGGSLRALVERVTRHDMVDLNFNTTFLLTYSSITSAQELFNHLVRRFTIQPPPQLTNAEFENWVEKKQKLIRVRVLSIMKMWLETHWMEPADDKTRELLRSMYAFARDVMLRELSGTNQILTLIETRLRGQEPEAKRLVLTMASQPPPPVLPRNMKKLKFLDIEALEFARQLTIIESRSYAKLKAVECLSKGWSKQPNGGPDPAENIRAIIMQSNQLTNWVAEMILTQSEARRRVLVIRHFVAVAEKCRQLNNFSTLTAILAALQTASIHRLRRTWEHVPARINTILEGMNQLMSATMNFAEYREMLHIVNPPCVPFLGVYLKDLTFVADGNDDFIKGTDLINFGKRSKTANIIREIQQYQSVPYPLQPVPELQDYIITNMQSARDVNEMYSLSLTLEPREREDEKIARLLQESGFL